MTIYFTHQVFKKDKQDDDIIPVVRDRYAGDWVCWWMLRENYFLYNNSGRGIDSNNKLVVCFHWTRGCPYNNKTGAGRYRTALQRERCKRFWREVALPELLNGVCFNYELDDETVSFVIEGGKERAYYIRCQQLMHDMRMFTEWPGVTKLLYRLHKAGVPFLDCLALSRGILVGETNKGTDAPIFQGAEGCNHILAYDFNPLHHKKLREERVLGDQEGSYDEGIGGFLEVRERIPSSSLPFPLYKRLRGEPDEGKVPDWAFSRGLHIVDLSLDDLVKVLVKFWKEHMKEEHES